MKVNRLNEMSDNKISLDSMKKLKDEYLEMLSKITNFLRLENRITKDEFVTNIFFYDDIIEVSIEDDFSSKYDELALDAETTQNIIKYLNNPDEYLASKKYNL